MISSRSTYLLLILLVGLPSIALSQVDTTAVDSVVVDSTLLKPVELLPEGTGDEEEQQEDQQPFTVTPWEFHPPVGAELVATDSTLRWQNWPDWTYRLNREPGVISYRLGTSVRSNSVLRDSHEPRHQQLYWEGISLNDPVTGSVNWSLIPQHKISEFYSRELGTEHRSTYYLHQYYLNKPLSRMLYSESKFSYQNLKFELSHNLSKRTNVELSYWDRRAGGEYPNSEVAGRQIYGKISHHLTQNQYLKINYINNNFDIGQPFGYEIPNLGNYNFDRFTATPNRTAQSQTSSNLLAVNYYQRSADTTEAVDNFHAGIFYRGNERSLSSDPDSTHYQVQSVGANAKKWWNFGGLTLESSASYEQFFNKSVNNGSLIASNWSLLQTEGQFLLDYTPIIDLKGGAAFILRSDGFQSYRLNAESDIEIGPFTLTAGASTGSVIPSPQQLYWRSAEYEGDPTLQNEKIQEARGSINYQITPDAKIGFRAQHKDITDGIMVTADSTFGNVPSYGSQSVTAFFDWNLEHFEFEGSATAHRYTDSYTNPSGIIPMSPAERVWLKGSAYWKGYLFDRATYVKAGLSGMLSPFSYQADHYYPSLDYWQPVSDDQQLPFFSSLDADISARVRSIIFVLRWENVLDDVSQLGYFETAQYPMTQRRFIFEVRVLFRN